MVEAVEHVSRPWVIALQWHPEHAAVRDPHARELFVAFVAAAAERGRLPVRAAREILATPPTR